jgi:hypothetical protein
MSRISPTITHMLLDLFAEVTTADDNLARPLAVQQVHLMVDE